MAFRSSTFSLVEKMPQRNVGEWIPCSLCPEVPTKSLQGDVEMPGEPKDHLGSEPGGLRGHGICNKRQLARTRSWSQYDSPNIKRPAIPSRDTRDRPAPAILLQVPEKSWRMSGGPEASFYCCEDTYSLLHPCNVLWKRATVLVWSLKLRFDWIFILKSLNQLKTVLNFLRWM